MEIKDIKNNIGKYNNEEEGLRKSFEYGKSIGFHEKQEKNKIKEEKKTAFRNRFNEFLKNISPVIFFLGIIIIGTGIWFKDMRYVWIGLLTSAMGVFTKFVEV